MSEQTKADASAGPDRRPAKIGSTIVVIVLAASVLLTVVQAFGPESWRAGNPVFGPEGDYIGPPPSDEAAPPGGANATDEDSPGAEDGKPDDDAEDSKSAEDGTPSQAGDGSR